jgi:hypothetical protein
MLLLSTLYKHGVRTKYFTIRDHHLFAYILLRFLLACGAYEYVSYPFGFKLRIPRAQIMRRIVDLWLFLELVSLVLVNLKIVVFMKFGYRIVMERYLYDSAVTVNYWITVLFNLGEESVRKWDRLTGVLFHFIPKDAFVIYLDVDYGEAKARYKNRVGMTARKDLFFHYRAMGTSLFHSYPSKVLYIDTTGQNVPGVQAKICSFLGLLSG